MLGSRSRCQSDPRRSLPRELGRIAPPGQMADDPTGEGLSSGRFDCHVLDKSSSDIDSERNTSLREERYEKKPKEPKSGNI